MLRAKVGEGEPAVVEAVTSQRNTAAPKAKVW
jgi:hypothetical protein